jgi:hypothetical protein
MTTPIATGLAQSLDGLILRRSAPPAQTTDSG